MEKIIWIILAFAAGSILPVQGGLNARLGKAAGNPETAALISFAVGTVALLIYMLITRPQISWDGLRQLNLFTWTGGILGAYYVTVMVLAYPRLGPGVTFGLVVAGQMSVSLFLEHYNVLVTNSQPINWYRLAGMVLVVGGVILIRKF